VPSKSTEHHKTGTEPEKVEQERMATARAQDEQRRAMAKANRKSGVSSFLCYFSLFLADQRVKLEPYITKPDRRCSRADGAISTTAEPSCTRRMSQAGKMSRAGRMIRAGVSFKNRSSQTQESIYSTKCVVAVATWIRRRGQAGSPDSGKWAPAAMTNGGPGGVERSRRADDSSQ
jgi:hypothetical protein